MRRRPWAVYTGREKRKSYLGAAVKIADARVVANGTREVPVDDMNSLVHKLLHAAEVIPIAARTSSPEPLPSSGRSQNRNERSLFRR